MSVSSIALQGLEQAQGRVESSARRLSGAGASAAGDADTVNLSSEMVGLISSRNEFATNANVMKIADQMEKTAINPVG